MFYFLKKIYRKLKLSIIRFGKRIWFRNYYYINNEGIELDKSDFPKDYSRTYFMYSSDPNYRKYSDVIKTGIVWHRVHFKEIPINLCIDRVKNTNMQSDNIGYETCKILIGK